MNALTIAECLDLHDDLTREQYDLLHEAVDDRSHTEVFHPRICSLRDLRLWLNRGIAENAEFDRCEADADAFDEAMRH